VSGHFSPEISVNLIRDKRDDEREDEHPCDKQDPANGECNPSSTTANDADEREGTGEYDWCKCNGNLGDRFHDA
jgi:hypothetical protein